MDKYNKGLLKQLQGGKPTFVKILNNKTDHVKILDLHDYAIQHNTTKNTYMLVLEVE